MDWKERTKTLLAKKNMSQADLAKAIGVTKAAVSVWLNGGRVLSEKNTTKLQYQIAAILDVSPEYLKTGVSQDDPRGRSVPHLTTYQEMVDWLTTGIASEKTQWSTCPVDCSEKSFSFSLIGSAMDTQMLELPSLPHGSVLFIDPQIPLEFGKLSLFQDRSPVAGIYEEANGMSLLVFSNPRYLNLEVEKDRYIGRAIGSFQHFG